MAAITTETADETPEPAARVAARPRTERPTIELYQRIVAAGVFPDKEPVFL